MLDFQNKNLEICISAAKLVTNKVKTVLHNFFSMESNGHIIFY